MMNAPACPASLPGALPGRPPFPVRAGARQAAPSARSWSLVLGAVETAPGCARASLRDCLAQWGLRHLTDDAEAIASELVTNAIAASNATALRGGPPSPVTFWLGVQHGELCIRVWDPDPTPPPRDHASALADENGRGLLIVTALSHRWDWYPTANGGKFVWAALMIDAPPTV